MDSVPAAHKHGGMGATEARSVFGVEWSFAHGNENTGIGLVGSGCEEFG